ncbi:2-hydroxyacid dehydrogenase [Embleya sp. NBC_00896]|uniref:2-hydroxyacid dehydrogenase n=1 Tax=Embleya sp. NBC_00896 TaxID=2975961 RepID=UPI00386762A4|nr:2-hydroxyacid dehydrogenase [Embleya sp. NBC_00896]
MVSDGRIWVPYTLEQLAPIPTGLGGADGGGTGGGIDVYDGLGGPVPESAADVEFYVLPYTFDREPLKQIAHMPRLKAIQTLTAGYEHALPYLPPGVVLCNGRGIHEASTAELALALTLAALRDIPGFVRGQDTGEWLGGFYPALADKTVLIIGYGAIGEAVDRRLQGFEVDVVRVARTARAGDRGPVHAMAELPELLPRADVVILTVPLTEDTRGLVDADFLARLPDGALVVNVARGPVVDTKALLVEVTAGRIRAALDVTDPEPLPADHPLRFAPGVLISPHVGGSSSAFLPRALRLIREQLERWSEGVKLANIVRD